jgi:NAD(P)H-hydrate repair Nnr-like enzyme with NAD(P)H-hydrate epimerase domain
LNVVAFFFKRFNDSLVLFFLVFWFCFFFLQMSSPEFHAQRRPSKLLETPLVDLSARRKSDRDRRRIIVDSIVGIIVSQAPRDLHAALVGVRGGVG